ncbi:cyclic nucleotide-binding-like protein [Blyttiomyces helicus]|uniref:Cyclic nucleotide-binding-like protein n=1 Tax=Blyttiomyces helicus TaxID=388810 RepID=A0A4P9WC77_9FUNG|nr:cyclic nucleotide-binding-like protein [Blyttiomyces helicus]|eukprot:RKO90249.1 cyclic nucleotide-binding-like protein [Blyttiomyces helicus]
MYFILDGTVAIVVNDKVVASLKYGSFFGEVALIAQIPRTATVRALTPCHLYRLNRVDFMLILEEFEDMALRVDLIYAERMAKVRAEEEAKVRAEEERKRQELLQDMEEEEDRSETGSWADERSRNRLDEVDNKEDLAEQGAAGPINN